MTQERGHRRWAFLLFVAFFVAPLVTLTLFRAFRWSGWWFLQSIGLLLLFLVVIVLLAVLSFFFFARKGWYKTPPFEGLKDGASFELNKDDLKNRTAWRQRAFAVINGMLNFEFFGWIVWVTAVLAGIASSFKHTLDQIKITGVVESYLGTINVAAGELILASIIGAIVLFFVQLLNLQQNTILKAGEAAEKAGAAAQGATQAVAKTGEIIPDLELQVERTLNILDITGNILGSETLSHNLSITLRKIADNNPALEQIRELSEMIVGRINQIHKEITYSYGEKAAGRNDHFDLVTLAAIYTTYLKVETLSFDGEAVGERGCRLSTRYPNYALAVRSVVKALHRLDGARYKYYTIFNRKPVNFFNPERPDVEEALANVSWTVLFLENFCRWHYQQNIPYTRYFVEILDDTGRGQIPPLAAVVEQELEDLFILCNIRQGNFRPCLWGEAAKLLSEKDAWTDLSEAEANMMNAMAKEITLHKEVEQTLKTYDSIKNLANPSYVILKKSAKEELENAVGFPKAVLEFRQLKEILLNYHSQTSPPQRLGFDTEQRYKDFFGKQIPHDLLAVWDNETINQTTGSKGGWCLCIGTMVGESDPTAVEMICMTAKRQLRHLSWDTLSAALSDLFLNESTPGITRTRL
jgi:hypothetical protein